jgi:hypothetical protein
MLNPKDICVLVSYDNNFIDVANVSTNNIKDYCDLHGYTLWVDTQKNIDPLRSSQWQKIRTSIKVLNENNFKWLFFLDSDCLIMNTTIKLETIIDDDYSFIVPSHNIQAVDTPIPNSMGTDCVITSQFLVKNNEIGLSILQDIWDANEWPTEMSINTHDYEGRQTRITINKPEFIKHVKIIEEKILNRFWYMNSPFMVIKNKNINLNCWEPGDFIVHVTGYKVDERIKLMSDLNYFSGGLISNWCVYPTHLSFSPLVQLNYIKFIIYNNENKPLIHYELNNLNPKTSYQLYIQEPIKSELIIKGFDENNKLLSLKLLK